MASRSIGKVREVWIGLDPRHNSERCDEDECSRLEVHHGAATLYIPYNAIAEVARTSVRLSMDAATVTEKGWHRKPLWIQAEARPQVHPFDARDWHT
jgi:hypothetical protein